MDNIIIIDKWTQTTLSGISVNLITALLMGGFIGATVFGLMAFYILCDGADKTTKVFRIIFAGACLLCVIMLLLGIILYACAEKETLTYYKIILIDEMSLNEFTQKYNIIRTETSETGHILYTVTLK